MAFKALLFLIAAFLLAVSSRASYSDEEFKEKAIEIKVLAPATTLPVKPPTPAPPVSKPPTPAPPVSKPPTPAPPVSKPPTPVPPVSKPPPSAPPVYKPPPSAPPVYKPPAPVPPVYKPPTPAPPVYKPPTSTPEPPVEPPTPTLPPVRTRTDCIPLCGERCKLHSRKNLCLRACMTCCDRCKCVPPGTYGNREKCGKCYTQMTTHHNKPKCP